MELVKELPYSECNSLSALALREVFGKLGLIRIGKSYFDLNNPKNVHEHKLQIFSGYTVLVNQLTSGSHVSLDTSHKVIRTDSLYSKLSEIVERGGDPMRMINEEIIGIFFLNSIFKFYFKASNVFGIF